MTTAAIPTRESAREVRHESVREVRSAGAAPSAPDAIAVARALAPRIRELAPAIERERRLPPELVAELTAGGLLHLLVPRSLGGSETDPVTAARAVEEVALADGSAGWAVMLAAQNAADAGFVPEAEARAIWSGGGNVAGTARPIGRAVAVDAAQRGGVESGYRVSGRWPFASGSSHATWFGAECTIYDGDEPRLDEAGNAVTRMLFVPREEVTVHDTWFATGLRGTASNDFSVDGAFVPAERGFQMLATAPQHPWALYRALPLVFMNHGSHALGLGRAAIEAAKTLAAAKAGWGGVPLRETPRIQSAIAEATALVESARAYLYASAEELWAAAEAGDHESEHARELRARVRLATSHAASASVRAVDLVHGALATSAIVDASPLERPFRDIHTAAAHVMIGPLTYEAAGRVELGLDAGFPFF